MPAGFWSEVFNELEPVEVGQPSFIHHEAQENDEELYICDVK